MANQYCIQCGTLLPEDGVCLRCGAVYSFSEDGTLTIHPRKVKRVTAKTSVKKRIFAKRSLGLEEDDTQAINIPEEIFSHSDHRVNREKHQDWTGEEEDYIPNYVFLDSEGDSFSRQENNYQKEDDYQEDEYQEEDDYQENKPYVPVTPKPRKRGKGCALFFLFLLIVLLTSIFVFLSIDSSDSKEETTTTTSESTTVPTSLQTTTRKVEPVFTARSLQLQGGLIGNDYVTYSFDKSSARLDVYYSGSCPLGILLLPLVDGPDFTKKHLTLSILAEESVWSFDEFLCESDFITQGLIEEIQLHANGENGISESTYRFIVESGQLKKIVQRGNIFSYYGNGEPDSSEIEYFYDSHGRLAQIRSKDAHDESLVEKEYKYDSNGYLMEIHRNENNDYYSKDVVDTLKYSGTQLKSITPKGDFDESRTVTTFEYDEDGSLTEMRQRSYDKLSNEEYIFTFSSSEDIISIHIIGIEADDTYSFSRF